MKHCPYGGAVHKPYYVRLSPVIVQCLHPDCQKLFESACPDKERELWNRPDISEKINLNELFRRDQQEQVGVTLTTGGIRRRRQLQEFDQDPDQENIPIDPMVEYRRGAWTTTTTTTTGLPGPMEIDNGQQNQPA